MWCKINRTLCFNNNYVSDYKLRSIRMSTSTENFNNFLLIHCVCSLMYCILYTEFDSYLSSLTLNSTCDYPGSLNDRK